MKKLILIAFVLMLALCAQGAAAAADDSVGVWYLNAIEIDGVSMSPAALELDMTLVLDADGSAVISMAGEEDEAGRWYPEGDAMIVDIDGDPMPFSLADGMLITGGEEMGMTMIFGRAPEMAETFEPAPAVNDPNLADFNGIWNATLVDLMGAQLPISALGMEMILIIEDGTVTAAYKAEGDEETVSAEGALEDGALIVYPGEEDDEAAEPFALTLHEDGTLSYIMEDETTIYFERQIAE